MPLVTCLLKRNKGVVGTNGILECKSLSKTAHRAVVEIRQTLHRLEGGPDK
jgi:hypothetical protein